ncbi:Aquaporin NIP3-1 [Acorus gramineus]|uniref:Aquaporin NIP3-1 n=1 Tax=Acorus gramineus TaxID=55184 RepID=A0AAV9B9A5_ACOGR|nr:Aquaporin NIP3-1 [Acorus gramineus]
MPGPENIGTPDESALATPGTPAPLFPPDRIDSLSYERNSQYQNSTPRGKCSPLDSWVPNKTRIADIPIPCVSLARKIGAEFFGTFILIFGAAAAPIVNQKYEGAGELISNAASAGLAVMVVILSTGHISGAHLNPSVTIAFAALRHFPWIHVPAYIAAQVCASVCASFALKGIYNPFMSGGVTVPSVSAGQAFALEFVTTFILMFVITAVATDTRAVGELAGLAIGATVMMNILIAGPLTGASMNPVRTIGPAIAARNYKQLWIYFVAPTAGATTGAVAYTMVKLSADGEGSSQRTRRFPP